MALQYGLGAGDRVARHIPEAHIVIGIAEGFGSSIPAAGHVHHEGMRLIRIGEMNGGMTERVCEIERLWLDAGFNVRAFADINVMIWEKFLCNVTLSAPCAVFDVTVGELMADPDAWKVALGCTAEAHRLGGAKVSNSPSTTRCATCPSLLQQSRTQAHRCGWTTWRDVDRRSTSSTVRS